MCASHPAGRHTVPRQRLFQGSRGATAHLGPSSGAARHVVCRRSYRCAACTLVGACARVSGASVYALRGGAYVALLLAPGAWSLWGFVVIMGFSWWATLPLTSALTAEVYGLKHLGILNGLAFTGHQLGGALSTQLGGTLRDLTGSYDLPFAIAALLLFGASLVSFALREQRYSTRYQPTASATGD